MRHRDPDDKEEEISKKIEHSLLLDIGNSGAHKGVSVSKARTSLHIHESTHTSTRACTHAYAYTRTHIYTHKLARGRENEG